MIFNGRASLGTDVGSLHRWLREVGRAMWHALVYGRRCTSGTLETDTPARVGKEAQVGHGKDFGAGSLSFCGFSRCLAVFRGVLASDPPGPILGSVFLWLRFG
jgi:hypothetical protein